MYEDEVAHHPLIELRGGVLVSEECGDGGGVVDLRLLYDELLLSGGQPLLSSTDGVGVPVDLLTAHVCLQLEVVGSTLVLALRRVEGAV